MLGWWIVVAAQTPEERNVVENRTSSTLATWEVGPGGLDWLQRLVKDGRASQLSFSGYPNRYTARASDVLSLLERGPLAHTGPVVIGDDYVIPVNWKGIVTLHRDRIAGCAPEQVLTIEAWDQS